MLSATLVGLAALVGSRFVAYDKPESDRVSFRLYTVRAPLSLPCVWDGVGAETPPFDASFGCALCK